MSSAKLWIEELDLRHAPELFEALNDERVGLLIGGPDVTTLAKLEKRIQHLKKGPSEELHQRWFNFVVLLNSVVIGRVEATAHDGISEIAYLIDPLSWGQGFGTSATELLLNDLREEGESEFWATTAPENLASISVLGKLGFAEVQSNLAPMLLSYEKGDRIFHLTGREG